MRKSAAVFCHYAMSEAGKRKGASSGAGPSSAAAKRVRIDAPADETDFFDGDPELDEVARSRRQRKGRITERDMGGESSDESDADEGAPDEDMFAASDDERKSKEDKTKFVSLGELDVGQEFGSTKRGALDDAGGEDADPDLELEETDSEPDDNDVNAHGERTPPTSPGGTPTAASRTKRTKGPKITGFNMKEEMKSGQFDADGNYHERERDPQAQHDAWLAGVYSKTKIRAARLAQEARERDAAAKERQAEREDGDEDQVRKDLTEHMHRGETVQRTLQRLGKRAAELRKQAGDSAGAAARDVETVTHLASVLMSRFGQLDVYDETYESLLAAVHKSGLVRQTFDPAARFDAPAETWEYKWAPAYLAATAREAGTSVAPDVEVFGPFSHSDLTAWAQEGYFGPQHERILLRKAASQDPWLPFADSF